MKSSVFYKLTILLLLTIVAAQAEEKLPLLEINGDDYSNITVLRVTATDIHFTHSQGIGTAKLKNLSPDLQKHFNYAAKTNPSIAKATPETKGKNQITSQAKPLFAGVIQPEKIEPPAHFNPSRKAALPYFEKTTIEAYRKIGARNPKWDANAEIALRFWAYQICDEGSVANGPEFKVMRAATAQALKDGCDDPLVMYVAVRSDGICSLPDHIVRESEHKYYTRMIGALSKHPYPPIRQGLIYLRGAESMRSTYDPRDLAGPKQKATDWLNQAVDKIAEIDLGEVDREEFYKWAGELMDDYRSATGDRKQGYDRIAVALEKNSSNKGILPLRVAGAFYTSWAWDARGTGLADRVTEAGWKLFSERLAIARKALEEAWSKDPADVFVCRTMINVAGGECKRAEIEKWFQRGKRADPNYYELYAAKLHFLQPQWGGSEEEMLELGRECLRESRWDEGIPFMLVGAHEGSR